MTFLSLVCCQWSLSFAQVNIHGSVYGGARQANVGQSTSVTIAAEQHDVIINAVFGGSDVAGTIGEKTSTGNSGNAAVKTENVKTENPTDAKKLFIGQLYGGGNGDYLYKDDNGNYYKDDNGNYIAKDSKGNTVATSTTPFDKPEVNSVSLNLEGGTIGYVYGGGNNATVHSTTITINNKSDVVKSHTLLTTDRLKEMGLNTVQTNLAGDCHFARVFGGNNKADMDIMPTWDLRKGKIRDLYSGGNEGRMIYKNGLLLEIAESSDIEVINVYGGCRKADVRPMEADANGNLQDATATNPPGYFFPPGLAARVLVRGGKITNVYGGNDITGTVYGGNAVGVYTTISGNIYGGGNGSYSYTDNAKLKDDPTYGDYYYDVKRILGKKDNDEFSGLESAQALKQFRPNAEQVSIRILGTEEKPTVIHGSIYCGGNSASLKKWEGEGKQLVELKIGSYAIADEVFLGNNGEDMLSEDLLARIQNNELTIDGKEYDFSQMNLTNSDEFAAYMDGVAMNLVPSIAFDSKSKGDKDDYDPYTSWIGSFYCGGNRGSMTYEGLNEMNFFGSVYVYDKIVGGCNNAYIEETANNATYDGGILGTAKEADEDDDGDPKYYQLENGKKIIKDRLKMTFKGVKIMPMRWNEDNTELIWNTVDGNGDNVDIIPAIAEDWKSTDDDKNRRLRGGNIYGGCFTSGHVNGNVIINIDSVLVDCSEVFDEVETNDDSGEAILYGHDSYTIKKRNSGVILDEQGMEVLGKALNVFGGGYGKDTEIWGSTTINLNKGYAFQVFGGSQQGVIGKSSSNGSYTFNKRKYNHDSRYSTTINLKGAVAGVSKSKTQSANLEGNMAEAEFIYGGGFEGPVVGNCIVNLGNGRIFNSFAGACNADVLGHTETYIGRQVNNDGTYGDGFPWIRDYVYGANDLGGKIKGTADFTDRVKASSRSMVYKPEGATSSNVLMTAAYTEYIQGRAAGIFGGCYGDYDYQVKYKTYSAPTVATAFVNFSPKAGSYKNDPNNTVSLVYGAGQGHKDEPTKDRMQDRSYVLIDIPAEMSNYSNMKVFGGGAFGGVGMDVAKATADANADGVTATAIVDLVSGQIDAAFGASYHQGVTRRTIVNVPSGSTIQVNKIFGGAYGDDNTAACDAYEATVNYSSASAVVTGAIYGGNNSARRTLYGKVNINTPVYTSKLTTSNPSPALAQVYGAGYGADTWSQYTEINLNSGARVKRVYGGGQLGRVLNVGSVNTWIGSSEEDKPTESSLSLVNNGYTDNGLTNALATYKYNTNVLIQEGATVEPDASNDGGYAYAGGEGNGADVCGTTHIELLGGTVVKDIYGGGYGGAVLNQYQPGSTAAFTASTTVNIVGGMVRNVYGGGWQGTVGYTEMTISGDRKTATIDKNIPGETYVTIGKINSDVTFLDGQPAITRSAFGGGEQGPVYGTSHLTINNGHIGYRYVDGAYVPELDETTLGDNILEPNGNAFGGGYGAGASVDNTFVELYYGTIRNCLFGGGEIAAVGRGAAKESGDEREVRELVGIYKAGKTNVKMYKGHVLRNVFGGGRGYSTWVLAGGGLFTDGYVFGQTEVNIYGGEVGTEDCDPLTEGNVFGGGDIGYVYSAYELPDGTLAIGKKTSDESVRYDNLDEGYYYRYENEHFVDEKSNPIDEEDSETEKIKTEDCKVLVEPWCLVENEAVTIDKEYAVGSYVPTSALNMIGPKKVPKTGSTLTADTRWDNLNEDGIVIHNAVFAGGNTSSGNTTVYANATTVFGNATASIHDIYHRDLVSIGTGRTGGLYGDGNLTFVDGYRGLNITNYGTDYYTIDKEIDYEEYKKLPEREQAYYEIRYLCIQECTDNAGTTYRPTSGSSKGSTLSADELISLFEGITVTVNGEEVPMVTVSGTPNPAYWVQNGICSRYAGRPMNTLQRADFCGVWGSRMVMQGAQDRVLDKISPNYTINRVREVSLNAKRSERTGEVEDGRLHGNYFGIYSIVNYLGALTSDVDFGSETASEGDVRTSDNSDKETYQAKIELSNTETYEYGHEGYTFFNWKRAHVHDRKRNNGNSHNQVALASGVYLELTSEKSTGTELNDKDWGLVTGVIELDLINVQTGVGGGFVYAKNEHGKRTKTDKTHTTITKLNEGAVSNKMFEYKTEDANRYEWQTSGNFVHSTQTIIDDCYNISSKYKSDDWVPAHYWFIKGQVYVYNQDIEAYTGAPNAYSETVDIPLTITAASHGKMKLLDVKENLHAYYSTNNTTKTEKLGADAKIVINDVSYGLNDPISYWEWYMLSPAEKRLFVEKTYVTIADCSTISDNKGTLTNYPAGTVLLPDEYENLKKLAEKKNLADDDTEEEVPTVSDSKGKDVAFDFVFRSSNNMSHENGYILTYKVNNPGLWDTWYTNIEGTDKKQTDSNEAPTGYTSGPTYKPSQSGLYGQHSYKHGELIGDKEYNTYQTVKNTQATASFIPTSGQADFEQAYIITADEVVVTDETGDEHHYYKNARVPYSVVFNSSTNSMRTEFSGKAEPCYVCTGTLSFNETEYIAVNTCMTVAERQKYIEKYGDYADAINERVQLAYYCTSEGLYGGNYYDSGQNYRALEAWSSMSAADRQGFAFNYDALDLLIDPQYSRGNNGKRTHPEGQLYQYDSKDANLAGADANKAHYSLQQPVDYTATYNGSTKLAYTNDDKVKTDTDADPELSRTEFESLLNEKHNYAPIQVKEAGTYYVVKNAFFAGEPYAVGNVISKEIYDKLDKFHEDVNYQDSVSVITFGEDYEGTTVYYCRSSYIIATEDDGGKKVKGLTEGITADKNTTIYSGEYKCEETVPQGLLIDSDNYYRNLTNNQQNFTIHGIAPKEYTTLYVSRNSDLYDLSTKKIITVIYQYDYEESDESAMHVTPVSERHVVNIHIEFKSGIPTIEDISTPRLVLPGSSITMGDPKVTPGAFVVEGGGWELFDNVNDAESHENGKAYTPGKDPLYRYQDGYYLAYYAKTYLGKTYSNNVNVSVANYHDLKKVMDAKEHHYYVDKEVKGNKPANKVYINDYGEDANGLDLLKQFYNLSVDDNAVGEDGLITTGDFTGHAPLDNHVKGGENLEFFLRTDIDHSGTAWTSIGTATQCFAGTLHGDGHTLSGLSQSLFGHLCGQVYNLGVTGSFTGAGVAEEGEGYVENCWISTTGTPVKAADADHYAVFGHPSRTGTAGLVQVVNCYYPESNDYQKPADDDAHGTPIQMPDQAFYNGEVAYDLNGFYLYKRYSDATQTSGTGNTFFTVNADNTLSAPQTKYYGNVDAKLCFAGYVEGRYADGDFFYANGYIPSTPNERLYVNPTTGGSSYHPIWPHDYLFFGQRLNYGYVSGQEHQDHPSAIVKKDNRIVTDNSGNRVYRAPAYFRSKKMGVAHFNPVAVFSATEQAETPQHVAYRGMTAIDFSGYNDGDYDKGFTTVAGLNAFYPPLLDDDGLTSFRNVDLTRNLLVYSRTDTEAAGKTDAAVSSALSSDPAYKETNSTTYRTVAYQNTGGIQGHYVRLTDANAYSAPSDHFLIDKEDFNAPIAYTFASGKRMWYQREPDRFVDLSKGWDAVSLPFTADIVTTHEKGELTHFFQGSETLHEYWLRQFGGTLTDTETDGIKKADFSYPSVSESDAEKRVTNTYLWDHYYYETTEPHHQDYNSDTYQTYYNNPRQYDHYPRLTAATPYILGLPGETYYEFDLSGRWKATTTSLPQQPLTPELQHVTFASATGITINVSDDEQPAADATGYTFRPTYLNNPSIGEGQTVYLLNDDGDSFDQTDPANVSITAFRPYFSYKATGARPTRSIVFGMGGGQFGVEEHGDPSQGDLDEGLTIGARRHTVVVTSNLRTETEVRITNLAGITVASFTLQPGETVRTPMNANGVYIVRTADGRYMKKLAVR